ncbi:MFS general substrate transporter [Dendrothele bispora CBS 962.96]|uniref:MFS general substrate transporter n=1 Tax=Dendrothele bispora (strain CBS 962.96) TaxID=1314807 RepID=A0A4S8L0E2_DENBC|nr:MFS general substrate transporter [Dendrothele bispora CBS 962.96]
MSDTEVPNQAIPVAEVSEAKLTRRVLWKLDTHILPFLTLLWLANYIDRTNIGNARIAGLEKDLQLHGNQFNTALAVFYASYLVTELPSNWVLKRFTGRFWLPFIMILWGVITTLTGIVQNFQGLIAIRVFLGFCEGGMLPGLVLYLSTLYRPEELQVRIGLFYAGASLAGAFGGLLATAIIKMDGVGGLSGWRWIFILEGIATILLALVSMVCLPASLGKAKFLTADEREFAIRRFRTSHAVEAIAKVASESSSKSSRELAESGDTRVVHQEDEGFEWFEVKRGIGMFGLIVTVYSFSLFIPTIVAGLGYTGASAQLHTVPPFVPAVVLTPIVSYFSDRLRWRGIFMLILIPIAIIGYIIAITATTNTARYAAVFLMATGLYPSAPCILAFMACNSSGHYKKATTTAAQLAVGNIGGFVATFAYTSNQAPKYITGHSISLGFAVLTWSAICANVCYCVWENKARREGRRADNVNEYQQLWESGKTRAPIGDRSPDFMFSL